MFYLHTRRTLANVSSDYKHLTPNHTISFQNLLIMISDTQFKKRFRYTQPLRSKYAIIIFIYIATTLPPQLLPARLTNISNTLSWAPITPSIRNIWIWRSSRLPNDWLKSYLSNHNQKCFVKGHLSNNYSLPCGIPQGTIPGPFLFVLYVNDLPNCLSHCEPRMYADDTLILSFGHIIICNNATLSWHFFSKWRLTYKKIVLSFTVNCNYVTRWKVLQDISPFRFGFSTPLWMQARPQWLCAARKAAMMKTKTHSCA